MIKLHNINKYYQNNPALVDINLHLKKNQTTILIGPSGCGKSTLLRLLAGLVKADQGKIIVNDKQLSPKTMTAFRLKMGYVIQEGGLFPHLTVRDNICLMAQQLHWERERIESRLEELTMLTSISSDLLRRYPVELSGGQRQRASLMRALMLDPDLLLLDEPLGALDPMIRYDLQNELKSIFQNLQKTVVMVTHDIAEAAFFSHTLVLLRNGKIVQQGNLADLFNNPHEPFVERFINAQRGHLDMFGEITS